MSVFIVCPGVQHVARGFETYALECFAALRDHPELEVTLIGGSGPRGAGRRTAWTLRKDGRPALTAARVLGRDGYWVEQATFAVGLLPALIGERPDVVLFSDWVLGFGLGRLRERLHLRYRLLMSNGAPGYPPFDPAIDHVQQLTPIVYEAALAAGAPASHQTLLPLGVAISDQLDRPSRPQRAALRAQLGLPRDGELLLSVAALNMWSKRLDYLIREVARLEERPHLLLLGERDDEADAVLARAESLLGPDGFTHRRVAPSAVADYYRAADMFVLASIHESMGRVLVEALSHGCPTIAHDGDVMRFVTGGHAELADLERDGELARAVERVRGSGQQAESAAARHAFARDNFSWQALTPRYVEMLRRCAAT